MNTCGLTKQIVNKTIVMKKKIVS